MASTITAEEINIIKQKIDAARESVKNNPKEAIRFLNEAGITDKAGKLTAPYRTILKK